MRRARGAGAAPGVASALAWVFALGLLSACGLEETERGDVAGGTVDGLVTDAMSGAPVAGATVRVEGSEASATTAADGRFELEAPALAARLAVEAPGYLALSRGGLEVAPGERLTTRVELYQSDPDEALVDAHMHRRALAQALRDAPDDPALRPLVRAFLRGEVEETALLRDRTILSEEVAGVRRGLDAPPATVRIWRRSIDGASASCSGRIDVIPLEDYVKGVLPHEWIPSWHDESLRAGSLAIRTYVWNWVRRGGKYDCADLDDTTRSQVYRDDRVARASAAVDTTRGQGVTRSGSLVSGEYSAEHGSPTADGVTDALCAGRTRSGHGRGMCQWGSQRWALDGRDHRWIASHYWPGAVVEGGTPPRPAYAAELVGMDVPADLEAGERAVVWIELRNTGATTWDLAGTRLGTTRPSDHPSPFYDAENWLSDHRATAPDHSTYGPDTVGRFTFMITAPEVSAEATVTDTLGLVQEGVTWFGPDDVTLSVRVRPRATTPPPAEPPPAEPPPAEPPPAEPPTDGGLPSVPVDPGAGTTPLSGPASRGLTGGCAIGGGGHALAWLAPAMLLALRRRRRS